MDLHPLEPGPRSGAHVRILLAEDDPELRMLLALRLRREGYLVFEVADGRELREFLSIGAPGTVPVDVIVSDVRMPGLRGLEILSVLADAIAAIPVILMTGFDAEAVLLDPRADALFGILDKPLDVDDLRGLLVEAVRAGWRARTPSPRRMRVRGEV
jgi:CheY-like chemotaxis protein